MLPGGRGSVPDNILRPSEDEGSDTESEPDAGQRTAVLSASGDAGSPRPSGLDHAHGDVGYDSDGDSSENLLVNDSDTHTQ